jgi:predicted nucleotidyltransferase
VYSANPDSAIYEDIAAIVRKVRSPTAALRSALASRRKIKLAFIFGSFATGSATASSDVDLMVLGDDTARRIRTALASAERDLQRSVNEHVMTTGEWRARLRKQDPFLTNVRPEPKLWVIGDEDQLSRLDQPGRRQAAKTQGRQIATSSRRAGSPRLAGLRSRRQAYTERADDSVQRLHEHHGG